MTKDQISPGLRVETLHGENDTDCCGSDRSVPPGEIGWIDSQNHTGSYGVRNWNVHFDNGCWVVIDDNELLDAAKYTLREPGSLYQCCLYLQYGLDHRELTMLDDSMVGPLQTLCDNAGRIVRMLRNIQYELGYLKEL